MAGYRLCTTKRAVHPFFVESVSVNLYSAEELCFFLCHNPYLIDDTIVSGELTKWLAEELSLGETALKMEQALLRNRGTMLFLKPLFRDLSYLSEREFTAFSKEMGAIELEPLWVRVRKKADSLLANDKIAEAARIYQKIIEQYEDGEDDPALSDEFLSSVWYHLGVANMRLFKYDEGQKAFYESYQEDPTKRGLSAYLLALKFALPVDKYLEKTEELELDGIDATLLQEVDEIYTMAVTARYDRKMLSNKEELKQILREYRNAAT